MRATSHSARMLLVFALVALSVLAASAWLGAGESRAGSGSRAILWKHVLNPTSGGDGLWQCAPAPGGGVYACGTTGWIYEDLTSTDVWVVRYKANGKQAWSRTWNGPDGRAEDMNAMVADATGDVYVAGATVRATGDRDTVLLKYLPDGTLAWATVYPASAGEDEAESVGLDGSGHVYVGGSLSVGGNGNAFVARFSCATGVRDWTAVYDSGDYDWGWRLAVTRAGESYVCGQTKTTLTGYDGLLVKVTADGVVAWARATSGRGAGDEYWDTVTPARGGGVLLAGEMNGTADSSEVAVARYSRGGARSWLKVWAPPGGGRAYVNGAALAKDGGLWVTGEVSRSGGADDRGFLGRWSAGGARRFAHVIGTKSHQVRYYDVQLDGAGNAYVAGAALASATGWDALLAKYSQSGALLRRKTTSFGGKHDDEFDRACLGPSGSIYAVGLGAEDTPDSSGVVARIRR